MLPWIYKISKFKKTAAVLFFAIVVVFVFFSIGFNTNVLAEGDAFGVQPVDQTIILSNTDIRIVILKIIRAVLGLLGILTLSLIVYAGFLIMTSGGEEEKVTKGKKTMINAVIGLVIIFSAFAIVQFVFNSLNTAINGKKPRGESAPALTTFSGSGALGKIVKDHYPFRDATDIKRNTNIIVTFGIPVEPSSIAKNTNNTCWGSDNLSTTDCDLDEDGNIIDPYYGDCFDINGDGLILWDSECDHVNTSSVKIDLKENVDILDINSDIDISGIDANVVMNYEGTGDSSKKEVYTIVFKPVEYLGSLTEKKMYTVHLRENIKKKDSEDSIFSDQFGSSHYYWNFETGTGLDLDPPHVENIYPENGAKVSKNTIIQINFDEPIDPTVAQGFYSRDGAFENILVNTENKMVTGTWRMTNGYRTVEFISDQPCGLNSCGDMMYCLPVDCTGMQEDCKNEYNILIRTAEWTHNAEAPFEAQPFSGVYDLSFNGLDNLEDNIGNDEVLNRPEGAAYTGKIINENEKAPDNYFWDFAVTNKIDLSRPYVEYTLPGIDTEDIGGNELVEIGFNKMMWSDTLNSIKINEYPEHVCSQATTLEDPTNCSDNERLDNIWFTLSSRKNNNKTITQIKHREFGPNGLDLYYFPSIPSTVKSVNQNCLYPGYGPWQSSPALNGHKTECEVVFNENGVVVSTNGCVDVNIVSSTDTGCSYTGNSIVGSDDGKLLKSNIQECIDTLSNNDVSPSQY